MEPKNLNIEKQNHNMQKEGFASIEKALTPVKELAQILIGEAKGKDGHTPTNAELLDLIKPLINEFKPPKDGHTPTDEELITLIRPLIPEVKDGETPSDDRLIKLIRPLIPRPRNGIDGKDGKDGRPGMKGTDGKDGSPDEAEEIIKKLQTVKRPWMDIEAIDGDFNSKLAPRTVIREFGGGNGRPLDVSINDVPLGGFREINFVGSGVTAEVISGVLTINIGGTGGGISIETPSGAIDASNKTFTVTHVPLYIVRSGTTYFEGAGYTRVGLTITTSLPAGTSGYIRSFYAS